MTGARLFPGLSIPRRIRRRRPPLKKLETDLAEIVARESAKHCQVRLMFQDGGRFGLLGDPRRCWALKGIRPVVRKRQFRQSMAGAPMAERASGPHDRSDDPEGAEMSRIKSLMKREDGRGLVNVTCPNGTGQGPPTGAYCSSNRSSRAPVNTRG